eukprot:gene12433-6185_t
MFSFYVPRGIYSIIIMKDRRKTIFKFIKNWLVFVFTISQIMMRHFFKRKSQYLDHYMHDCFCVRWILTPVKHDQVYTFYFWIIFQAVSRNLKPIDSLSVGLALICMVSLEVFIVIVNYSKQSNRPVCIVLFNFHFRSFVIFEFEFNFTRKLDEIIPGDISPFPDLKTPIILSHRGSRFLNPENSRPAFYSALDMGTDVLETDVRLTKDHRLVIFHDRTVERTTNGTGLVHQKTLEEMKLLNLGFRFTPDKGKTFPYRKRHTQVLELNEFFEEFIPLNVNVNIELKDEMIEAADAMWEVLKKQDLNFIQKHVNIISSYWPVIERLRFLSNGTIPTSACEFEGTIFILSSKFYLNLFVNPLDKIKPNLFQIPCIAAGGAINLKTKKTIDDLHAKGKKVHYWVINDKETMKEVLELGADGLITDRTDLAMEVWVELGLKKSKKPTKEFYLPTENFIESYTCTIFLCRLIENFKEIVLSLILLFSIFLAFVYYNCWRCQQNKKTKKE